MKRSDITDEMVYEDIRKCKTMPITERKFPYELRPEIPVKVYMAKMEQMAGQGKLNYGVSLRTAWIEENQHS